MKKILALLAAIAALASCTVKEPVGPERTADSPILHASFEGLEATRTFVGEDLRLFWTADDRISVFPGTTDNLQYRFLGGTGDRSGDFEEVTPSGARTGSGVDAIYAVYPYQPAACLSADGAVTVELPAVQQYAPGTFGLGANTMVAVSSDLRDDFLYFRNVCGYIVVRLYGDETVKSIMFKGNDGERIAGRGTVRASHSAAPAIVMADDATTSITIDCGEGVKLGASADAATEFWFCIPPVTFAKGFSITVTNTDGLRMTKSLNSSKTVTRNVKVAMSALKTVCDTRVDFVIFADANFKAYCVQNFDKDGDGEVSLEEGKAVTAIDVNTDDIESLDGIQYFPNLSRLKCSGSTSTSGKLRSLDLSKNTALTNVFCDNNQITVLDVSKNTALKTLRCSCNKLTSLDVSNNTALTTLSCYDNQLEILDVSKNTALETLNCHFNPYLKEIWLNAGQTILNFRYDEDVATVKYRGACEAVDLGLPSGIKWASFNLGATNPEEYGGYYQWGGLQDVTDTSIFLDWSNCPYHTGSDGETGWMKYIPWEKSSYWSGVGDPDNKTVLDPDDDIAHVKLGGNWRMPSKEEFDELIDNCTSEWTTMNGVSGRKFTSNKNGNSIFLPAAATRLYSYLYFYDDANYWSSSLDSGFPSTVCNLEISQVGVKFSFDRRFYGLPVRPVSDEDVIRVTGISLDKTSVSLFERESEILTATISPSNAHNQIVTWSSSDIKVATVNPNGEVTAIGKGSATITVKSKDGGYTATCTVTVTGPAEPEAVDLGLSVKWASFNIGAPKPEYCGDYFQWGGLEDVTDTSIYLDWSNCPFHTGSDPSSGWTKYIPSEKTSYWSGPGSPDGKTVLDLEDDVAHVKWGGSWRMPTEAEFHELLDNCISEWTELNGMEGQKFTSKTNGNSIFFPASGERFEDGIFFVGSHGFYWTSSLCTDDPSHVYIMEAFWFNPFTDVTSRFFGRTVRPVSD